MGPQCEEDLCTKVDHEMHLTDFSRASAQEGVATHGRRFCSRGRVLGAKRDTMLAASTRKTDKGVQLRARAAYVQRRTCLLYTSPSPRDGLLSRMPSSA